jgi:hypothetical protein
METSEARVRETEAADEAEGTPEEELSSADVNNEIAQIIAAITASIPEVINTIAGAVRDNKRADAELERELRRENKTALIEELGETLKSIIALGPELKEASEVVAEATGGQAANIVQSLIDGVLVN